jgi:hypothetical protein
MLAHLAAEIQPICWGQQATQLSGPYTALSSRRCSCIDPTARRFTSRRPASSCVHGGTNGTVRVACSNGPIIELPVVTMTSGASAARSAAFLRMRWRSPSDQRTSISRLRPSLHPSCCRISRNAATRTCPPPDRRRTRSKARRRAASGRPAGPSRQAAMRVLRLRHK